jgi:hypothetical protein
LFPKIEEQDGNKHGGNNKEQILMNINTFKKFCLKAGTKANNVLGWKAEKIIEDICKDAYNFANNK